MVRLTPLQVSILCGFSASLKVADSFIVPSPVLQGGTHLLASDRPADQNEGRSHHSKIHSRRGFIIDKIFTPAGVIGTVLTVPSVSVVNAYPQEAADKKNIKSGYERLEYLLANWEEMTTICKRNDNPYIGCDRSPEKVMEYLGYKSMEDPLFRADKTLKRLQTLVPESNDADQDDFQNALDVFG